jgi:Tol biopolymer transport system component
VAGRFVSGAVAVGIAWHLTAAASDDLVTIRQHDTLRSPFSPPTVDITADGRFVAFESFARLVPADTDGDADVYVLDRRTGVTTLETGALEPGVTVTRPRISGDGRLLVFQITRLLESGAPQSEIVLCDRQKATLTLVSKGVRGEPANGSSRDPDISDNGRVVVFSSTATNLTSDPDANAAEEDVFAWDVASGILRRVNVTDAGAQPSIGASFRPSINADGQAIAFVSLSDLDHRTPARPTGAQRRPTQIFVRDLALGKITRISRTSKGRPPEKHSSSPTISGDGRYVAFVSESPEIVEDDRNNASDVFLYDRLKETMTLVSRSAAGGSANGVSTNPEVSFDGRFVAFQSDASNIVCAHRCPAASEDLNLLWDVFVFDRFAGRSVLVSGDENGGWMEASDGPALAASAPVVAFSSRHPIDMADRTNDFDLFIRAPFEPPPISLRVK